MGGLGKATEIDFRSATGLPANMSWFNEPAEWRLERELGLCVFPAAKTDFWQRTHYGFRADSGHLLYLPVDSDFVMIADVAFHPVHQYDQAGLMVRFSEDCWIKTSVEYEPEGLSRLGCVVTNAGYSDWSTQDFPEDVRQLKLRIMRVGSDFHVHVRRNANDDWMQIRIAHLSEAEPGREGMCGLYACSPQGSGFRAEFKELTIFSVISDEQPL